MLTLPSTVLCKVDICDTVVDRVLSTVPRRPLISETVLFRVPYCDWRLDTPETAVLRDPTCVAVITPL